MALTLFTYHRIQPKTHPDAISSDVFKWQLDMIQSKFKILTPEEMLQYIAGTISEKTPCAALSFDDGWLDNWLYATPILKERNLKATLALSTGFLHDGEIRATEADSIIGRRNLDAEKMALSGDTRCYLRRSEVKAMHDSGAWSIQAHGTRHAKNAHGISSLAAPSSLESIESWKKFLKLDLENCKAEIFSITGISPELMFWPWGHYSANSAQIAKSCGFKAQFTTTKDCILNGDSRDVLPRVSVSENVRKFKKNLLIFRNPIIARLRNLVAHQEKVFFK